MPLSVSISLKSADKTRIDLANLLSMHGHCNLVENYQHYSEDFLALRNPVDFGIKAVPSETYPEKNFFMLLIDEDINSSIIKKELYETTYIDWTKAVVMRGDLLPVEVVEISDYKTVYLHPTLSSGDYLVKLLADYDYALEESQDEVMMNPPVFQPNVGLIVMAQVYIFYTYYLNTKGISIIYYFG